MKILDRFREIRESYTMISCGSNNWIRFLLLESIPILIKCWYHYFQKRFLKPEAQIIIIPSTLDLQNAHRHHQNSKMQDLVQQSQLNCSLKVNRQWDIMKWNLIIMELHIHQSYLISYLYFQDKKKRRSVLTKFLFNKTKFKTILAKVEPVLCKSM